MGDVFGTLCTHQFWIYFVSGIFIALFLIIVYQMCAYNIKNLVSLYPYHFEEQSKKPPQEAPKWCLQCDVVSSVRLQVNPLDVKLIIIYEIYFFELLIKFAEYKRKIRGFLLVGRGQFRLLIISLNVNMFFYNRYQFTKQNKTKPNKLKIWCILFCSYYLECLDQTICYIVHIIEFFLHQKT